jgi:hypothetical protein
MPPPLANKNHTDDFTTVFLSELADIKRRKGKTQLSKDKIDAEIDRIHQHLDQQGKSEKPEKADAPAEKELPECMKNDDQDRFGKYSVLPSTTPGLMGLALSGGGIRSATFNLGLLQALCNNDMLAKVDYLSTVSGGGYIGTCLTTLMNSPSESIGLDPDTFPLGRRKIEGSGDPAVEKEPVRRLRYFSNYLTAEGGFVAKYLRPAMVFVRGVVLNFTLIVPYIVIIGLLLAFLFNFKVVFPGEDNNPIFFDFREFSHILKKSTAEYNRSRADLRIYAVERTSELNFDSDRERIEWIKGINGSNDELRRLTDKIKGAKKPLQREWQTIWNLPGVIFAFMIAVALFYRVCYRQAYKGRYGFSKFLAKQFFISLALVIVQLYGILIVYWKSWEISAWIASVSLLSLIGPRLLRAGDGNGGTGKKMLIKIALAIGLLLLVPLFILYLVGGVIAHVSEGNITLIIGLIVGSLVLWYFNRRFINLNEISLHNYYRDCLSRAYMMQYDEVLENISHKDDLKFSDLDPEKSPYHIVNTALNLKKRMPDDNDSGHFRTGESFNFTRNWCGTAKTGYVKTIQYERVDPHIDLGTAMAISGAAANIGMAQKNIFVLRLLMGLLNIRLGYWALHPYKARKAIQNSILRDFPGSIQAFQEWFGLYRVDSDSRYINLSDGGHFDNIGVYELLRRRCKYIIVGDAEADTEMKFEAISYIMRMARIDFGIEIKINPTDIKPDPVTGYSRNHCAVGRIEYPEGDFGYLLYCKASLTGDEPEHLHEYKVKHPQFPHQTTADQWFNEQQFEAYRELGYHIGKAALAPLEPAIGFDTEEQFNLLKEFWYPHSHAVETLFTRNTVELNKIVLEIKKDQDLDFMDAHVYPEWEHLIPKPGAPVSGPKPDSESETGSDKDPDTTPGLNLWLPTEPHKIRKGFYLCNLMMQLMENVYTDLNLESEYNHPDNRGWMNLFRHWSWSGMFRVAWTISACTFGARFQKFCETYLDLDLGDLIVEKHGNIETAIEEELNPFEQKIVENFKRAKGYRFKTIFLLKLKVTDPIDQRNYKTFHFGFVLVNEKNKIIFFRIQDHLRKMGLGRMALKKLVESNPINTYSTKDVAEILQTIRKTDAIPLAEENLDGFQRMCNRLGIDIETR